MLCAAILAGVLATLAFAEEPSVAWIGETGYATLEAAVNAAVSGDTIVLGEGKFTLYGKGADTKGKDLTFVGQGSDKTEWGIGAKMPDPDKFGTEYNGDYSFDGAGTVTFKNMALRSGAADYLGFIRANHTVTENCVIRGKTFYWGYKTAIFVNTSFECPSGDYALWTYSSPEMTFDRCTFYSSGKVVNVYTDYGAGRQDIIVTFKDCTVNNSGTANKSVLNINDSNMGQFKYIIQISGKNTIQNIAADGKTADIFRDPVTCSRWFGFGGKAKTNNTGRVVVTIDGKNVFRDGKMVSHEIDTENDKYTEGYKDDAYTVTVGDWEIAEDGKYTRAVKKVCDYCGYIDEYTEEGYAVTFTDGVDGEEIFRDQTTIVLSGEPTPSFEGEAPVREGYVLKGWSPVLPETVSESATYAAVWEKKTEPEKPAPQEPTNPPSKPSDEKENSPKTGDAENFFLWLALMPVSGVAVLTAVLLNKKKKCNQ